jgi:acetyl-CoA synthetase
MQAGAVSAVDQPFWHPSAHVLAKAQATRLAHGLGLAGFTALRAFSIEHPDRYWQHLMSALDIVWSKPYHTYMDLSDGAPFPRWFLGGELNWTDTVFGPNHPPDRLAVVAETEAGAIERVTYGDLYGRVQRFAAGLQVLGVARGDRVALLLEMGVEAVVSFLAISHIGAVATPLFSGFGVEAITSRLSASGAKALITTTGFTRRARWIDVASTVQAARAQLPALEHIILKQGAASAIPGSIGWQDIAGTAIGPAARMDPNDPMMVIYTSGTTGKPKGAVHIHGGFPLKIAHDAAVNFDIGAADVVLWPADLGWVAGALTISSALMRGATLVTYDGAPDFPDWSRLSRLVEAHGVTILGASPTFIRGLAANEAQATLGRCDTLRLLITSGEVIDKEHMIWFHQHLGHGTCPVINYTGGTEVSGGLLGNVVVRPIVAAAFNSICPGLEADVLDAVGHPVRDEIGELCILKPFVGMTQSFWNDRARYLDSYWTQTPGVWTHGDLASRTKDDVLFLLGRSDDTLKVAGKRLGPAEVEDVLLELDHIAEAAAIGVEDPVKGQRLIVFIVPRAANTLSEAELERIVIAAVAGRLGKPFQPSRVHVVAQLPRTRSTKVMRRVIRRVYANQDPGDLTSLDNPDAIGPIREAALAG